VTTSTGLSRFGGLIVEYPFTGTMLVVVAPTSQDGIEVVNDPLRCSLLIGFDPTANALEEILDFLLLGHSVAAIIEPPDLVG
jgi:hypothetical protein